MQPPIRLYTKSVIYEHEPKWNLSVICKSLTILVTGNLRHRYGKSCLSQWNITSVFSCVCAH